MPITGLKVSFARFCKIRNAGEHEPYSMFSKHHVVIRCVPEPYRMNAQ